MHKILHRNYVELYANFINSYKKFKENNISVITPFFPNQNKKLIERWDGERELYDDIVHALQNTIVSCTNSATDRRGCVGRQVCQIQWNNAIYRPLRRSRLFKVADFGTNRKYLLVINTKKLIRRRDSERELSLRRRRTRSTKYNRLVHKFRHRSTRLCVGT